MALLLGGLLAAGASDAAEEPLALDRPFDVVADELEYERARDLYVARGNVRITQEGRTLSADWVSFSNRTRIGVASGNVVLQDGPDTLHAEFVEFEVDTLRGLVYQGELVSQSSRFRMQGEEVRKTGDDTYHFERARFTTCRCPGGGREPWAIEAQRADIEVGGYGRARNTTFEVLGIPVLWVPWAIYPLKTERETGFLLPGLGGSSRSGADLELPFFWAARHDLNVLLIPGYVSKRGFKPSLGLEYVFGEESGGELFASFIHDRDIDRDDPSTPFSENRWGGLWRHDHFLPGAWRFKADARFASDNQYPWDFRDLREHRADRFLESRGFLERHFGADGRLGLNAGVAFADDLQAPNDSDRDDVLLQRLPSIELDWLPGRSRWLPELVRSLEVDYAYFRPLEDPEDKYPSAVRVADRFLDTGIDGIPNAEERDAAGAFGSPDGSLDDFPLDGEGDGRFQEGEPLADRGHRVRVAPRLALPFQLAERIEIYPEIGYLGTFYESRALDFEDRHLATGRLDARTRFEGEVRLPGGQTLLHVLEPEIGWAWISSTDQDRNPLYVPATAVEQRRVRQLELDNVTRDPADRIERFHGAVLSLGNRFYRPGRADPLAELLLSTAYDFSESAWGWLVLEGDFEPTRGFRGGVGLGYDLDASHLAEAQARLAWEHTAGHELGVRYRYLRDIPQFFEAYRFDDERFDDFDEDFDRIHQLAASARAALTPRWALTGLLAYSFEESFVLRGLGRLEYVSRCLCWAAALEVSDDRSAGVSVRLRYTLLGLGDDRERPFDRGRSARFGF